MTGRFRAIFQQRRTWLGALLVFAGCFAGALASSFIVFPVIGTALLFPPYAVLTVALLMTPPRSWWIYILASVAGNFWPHLRHGGMDSLPLVLALEIANIPRALIAVAGIRWFCPDRRYFASLRGAFAFFLFAVVIGPAVGALIGALTVVWSRGGPFWIKYQAWLNSNMLTGMVLLPLLMFFNTSFDSLRKRSIPRVLEAGSLVVGMTIVGAYVFSSSNAQIEPAALYAPLPFLLWAAFRFGPGSTIGMLAVLSSLAIGGALTGRGPFALGHPGEQLIHLQYFLIAICVPNLLLASAIREQQTQHARLHATERSLRERDNLARMVSQSMAARTVVLDSAGNVIFVSTERSRLRLLFPTPQPGESYLDICLRAAQRGIASARPAYDGIQSVLARQAPHFSMEYALVLADGRAWFRVEVDPMPPDHGGVVVVHIDTTEQREAQERLREEQDRYRAVVEAQTDPLCRYRTDGTITFVNEAFCDCFNRRREDLIGASFADLFPEGQRDAWRAAAQAVVDARGTAVTTDREILLANGETRWHHWVDCAIVDDDGKIAELQAIGRDITARKLAEESLRVALHEVSHLKDRLEAHNAYLTQELSAADYVGELICRSPIMRQAIEQAQRVALTDTTVLIEGETGTGKELIAKAIHKTSHRSNHPFVRLNCAALPAPLIESELFGHERGAFTGADSRRLGRFEVANGGTLFLDELGELPLELQAKLLRVLQEGEYERLGSSETISVDVRLIAATNRKLADCVAEGTFRADLYYRLNVFPITVPPLRARKEDIVPLATEFLAKVGPRLGKTFAPISNAVAESLMQYAWPGNVRELENVIERAAISSRTDVLELPPSWDRLGTPLPSASAEPPSAKSRDIGTVPASINEMERTHILSILDQVKGRIEGPNGAAALLGINPSTLRFRMKKLGISRNQTPKP